MDARDIEFNVDIYTRHTNNEEFFSRELKSTRLVPLNHILYPRPEEGFNEKGRWRRALQGVLGLRATHKRQREFRRDVTLFKLAL